MVNKKKELSSSIDKYFSADIFINFIVLLLMPILNGWLTEHYSTMFYPIIILFLILLAIFMIWRKLEDANTFTSIFMLYLIVEATMPYKDWAIPFFSAYVIYITTNLHKFRETKRKK